MGSARLESLSGRRSKKGRRKGHSPPPQRTTTATAALLPRHFVSIPSLPLPRELSRERRAPTLPLPLRPRVPYFLDTFAAPGHAPHVCWGHPFGRGQSTRLGVVAEPSELLSWVSAVRKEIGCNSGMSESCSEGWNCHQSSAHCECPDEMLWNLSATYVKPGVSFIWLEWFGCGSARREERI